MRWNYYTNVLPKFTLEFSMNKEAIRGIKQDKTIFTACGNADESEKVRLTIISKYANPVLLKVICTPYPSLTDITQKLG